MRTLYLLLAIGGYLATNLLVVLESVENKNYLLWARPGETIEGLFINRISTIFAIDLLWVVLVCLVWMTVAGRRLRMKNIWKYWVLTFLFGLAGTLPLFLWAREKYLARPTLPN